MIRNFHAPTSVAEALKLRRRLRGGVVWLAGGTWVNATNCPEAFEHCIDLASLGLGRVVKTRDGLSLGATCTLQALLDDRAVPAPLKAALAQVVNRNVRNAATLGGHVAAAQQPSDILPMLVALDARVQVKTATAAKRVPLVRYLKSPAPGLITALVLPAIPRGRVAACRNFRMSAHARSLLSVAVAVTPGKAGLADPVIALCGVAPALVRLETVEAALAGRPLPALDEVQALVSAAVKPKASPYAGAALLRHEVGALVALALHAALAPKGGRS